jgi:MarR family 2-MHQ and catechol resistance regulon transcriptional repressor
MRCGQRVRTVVLTDEGKKVIEPVFRRHAALLARMFEPLTPEERNVLEEMLKRVRKHAETLSHF